MLASAGSVFDNSNASPDGDSQAAAPASPPGPIRSPAMRKPYVPPSMRLSATASGPPNSSNAAGSSNSSCSLPRQVLIRGLLWTPPDVDLKAGTDAETADLVGRLSTLTPQQVRVLMMLSEGLLNKQIAYNLTVSEATVKAHVSAILQKLNVESRTQAVIAAARIESGQWPQG